MSLVSIQVTGEGAGGPSLASQWEIEMGLCSAAWYPALLPSSACWGLWSLLAEDVKMYQLYILVLVPGPGMSLQGCRHVPHLPCPTLTLSPCPGHAWDVLLLISLAHMVHAVCMACVLWLSGRWQLAADFRASFFPMFP